MGNKTVDKRDLIMNQAIQMLLEKLKNHSQEDEFCNYVYLELTLGNCLDEYTINRAKDDILHPNGSFRGTKWGKYDINDLIDKLIEYVSINLMSELPEDKSEAIIDKYNYYAYSSAIESYLRALFGQRNEWINAHYNDFKEIINKYILS